MKRYKGAIFITLVAICFLLVLVLQLNAEPQKTLEPGEKISVVLYGDGAERWSSFDQGLRQACNELGLSKPAITLAGENDPEEQVRLLQREINSGAKGLIVAASNSEFLREYLQTNELKIPVVWVETGIEENKPGITASNTQMAETLAKQIAQSGVTTVALLQNNLQRQSVQQRYNAFCATMQRQGVEVVVWPINDSANASTAYVAKTAAAGGAGTLVALDNETLEAAANGVQALAKVRLYGIGTSDKVVKSLDNGTLSGLCFQNEFTIAYLGTMQLAKQMGIKKVPVFTNEIEHYYVEKQDMYKPEMERILFPITQ
ncbi:substrate-binding domain-containing protein [Ruminococcaceae bacterium OttesenSCG-928-A16]|nr:substrate-binding domain-containing protein [Ruminococcaceae bacterium OttesenSCG-928-A16]